MRTRILVALVASLLATPAFGSDLLKPGDPFPAWSLSDQSGKTVSSSSLAGKAYLVWFYPKAMTPGCTLEGQGLRDHFGDLQQRGIEIFGVSFDDPAANARFAQTEGFPYRLLSDSDRALATRVGAADSPTQAVARRVSFLVGPDGRVLHAYGQVDPATHAEQVLRDVTGAARP